MNKIILIFSLLCFYCFAGLGNNELLDGDIIFHESKSSQSKAIQIATKSKYSHMGIIYKKGDKYFVYEAVQPLKLTPLEKWINRGVDGHFVVKRLINRDRLLTPQVLKKMKLEGKRFEGKSYDSYFGWSDDKLYCSELVWKIYKRAVGIEIGKLKRLKDFDLSNPIVVQKLKERYGKNIPMNEKVISPADVFESELLESIEER